MHPPSDNANLRAAPGSLAKSDVLGCFLGLALGDATCAEHEGGILERGLWRVIGRTRDGKMRYTDDTQMSLDLAATLIAGAGQLDQDSLASAFAQGYRWSRGYGPGAAKILKKIARGMPWQKASRSVYAVGSYGNGAAMRAPVVGIIAVDDARRRDDLAKRSAEITHAHPLAIDAARIIAHATAYALGGAQPRELVARLCELDVEDELLGKLAIVHEWIQAGTRPSKGDVTRAIGVGMIASESPIAAVYFALVACDRSFDELIQLVITHGGDTDTVAAMAAAIWGAKRGVSALPQAALDELENVNGIRSAAEQLYALAG